MTRPETEFIRANRAEFKRAHRRNLRGDAMILAALVFGIWIALLALTN